MFQLDILVTGNRLIYFQFSSVDSLELDGEWEQIVFIIASVT